MHPLHPYLNLADLTYRGLNKMTIMPTSILNAKCYVMIQISLEFISEGSIDKMFEFIQVIIWRRSGERILLYIIIYIYYILALQSSDKG